MPRSWSALVNVARHGKDLHEFQPQSMAISDGGVEYVPIPVLSRNHHETPIYTHGGTQSLSNGPMTPNSPGSGRVLGSFKRRTRSIVKILMDGMGIVRMGELGRLEDNLESEEARFRSHLDTVSSINRTFIERTLSEHLDASLSLNYDPLELQSFVDSMRALDEDTSIILPYSRLLGAEQRQSQLDEATSRFQNRLNEFTLNSVLVHSSHGSMVENKVKALEEKVREFDQRIRALEDRLRTLEA
ncbi:unnamed protein product [Rhizoctonia solani]|uniref:Uncharacterized protein n=1 Tax=Rhizoctonia solani TaxID=456999 RepID=A0A8H3E901_9AGAM|nr:unnamed protein product [Rhizoctonia solani]